MLQHQYYKLLVAGDAYDGFAICRFLFEDEDKRTHISDGFKSKLVCPVYSGLTIKNSYSCHDVGAFGDDVERDKLRHLTDGWHKFPLEVLYKIDHNVAIYLVVTYRPYHFLQTFLAVLKIALLLAKNSIGKLIVLYGNFHLCMPPPTIYQSTGRLRGR